MTLNVKYPFLIFVAIFTFSSVSVWFVTHYLIWPLIYFLKDGSYSFIILPALIPFDLLIIYSALVLNFSALLKKNKLDSTLEVSVEVIYNSLNIIKSILIIIAYSLLYSIFAYHFFSYSIIQFSFFSGFQLEVREVLIFFLFPTIYFWIKFLYIPSTYLTAALFYTINKIKTKTA